ncbi:MAG: ABC transporter ATP-binding protein [Candidatus Omnitrophota bacterium]|jgi:lipoprotein-releasing system ATP-binding protein|nr:MAG: ABC transporter ATP-binding protein [Candidatus Omnitrophota bacterium]
MNETVANRILQCRNLCKTYQTGNVSLPVLKGVDLEVKENEFIAITGESGCGKSTLLHLLGCLDEPTDGVILLRESELSSISYREKDRIRNLEFGFVFQFHHLMPEFTALENVGIPGMIAGVEEATLWRRAETLLAELNLSERRHHKPSQLSGGEQQRVAVARAMINQPSILLMDEPTGNLDPAAGEELIALIRRQRQKRNLTIVMVTHNREIAAQADRRYELRDGFLQTNV